MFRKKTCKKCGASARNKHNFCPNCGSELGRTEEDLGMLGKNDSFNDSTPHGYSFPIENLLSTVRNLEKQFKGIEKRTAKPEEKKGHISISISTFGGKAPVIKMSSPMPKNSKKERRIKTPSFNDLSQEQLRKFSRLPREEPKTNIRRISNKVLYEIDMPGVKSEKDISILNLEKGVELKAVSDKKAYMKSIPISLPIISYKLSNGKLVLEMDTQGN